MRVELGFLEGTAEYMGEHFTVRIAVWTVAIRLVLENSGISRVE